MSRFLWIKNTQNFTKFSHYKKKKKSFTYKNKKQKKYYIHDFRLLINSFENKSLVILD